MAEFILGVGLGKSFQKVANIAEKELRKTEGIPRRIVARSPFVEFTAERPDFDGEFVNYSLRVLQSELSQDLLSLLADFSDVCKVSVEDGWQVAQCPANGEASPDRVQEALNKAATAFPMPETWRIHGDRYRVEHLSTEKIFQALIKYKASDVHLAPGQPAVFRVDNEARRSEAFGMLSGIQIESLIKEIAPRKDWDEFLHNKQCSFNFHQVGQGYARVSSFIRSGSPHCTMRFLPEVIPSFEQLNVPRETMVDLAKMHHGLLLVTGMTGSGKSTTVAALVDWINSNKSVHILTIENPVEYVQNHKKSIVSQRSTGTDVATFNEAVTGALRHDPDVIVIGEMRDPDTIRSAINAAATGHLVISTLHANTASEVVNRVVSFFDPVERDLVKLQLRDSLRCVICQRLLPKKGGGRVPALEILFNDIKPINDGIVAGDTDMIRIGMQQTVSHSFLFEKYLFRLYKDGIITLEAAREYASDSSVIDQMVMGTYSVPRLDTIKHMHTE